MWDEVRLRRDEKRKKSTHSMKGFCPVASRTPIVKREEEHSLERFECWGVRMRSKIVVKGTGPVSVFCILKHNMVYKKFNHTFVFQAGALSRLLD